MQSDLFSDNRSRMAIVSIEFLKTEEAPSLSQSESLVKDSFKFLS